MFVKIKAELYLMIFVVFILPVLLQTSNLQLESVFQMFGPDVRSRSSGPRVQMKRCMSLVRRGACQRLWLMDLLQRPCISQCPHRPALCSDGKWCQAPGTIKTYCHHGHVTVHKRAHWFLRERQEKPPRVGGMEVDNVQLWKKSI